MNNAENSEISKSTRAFGLSLALACVVNALLVVAKEKIPAVMSGMQKLTGHHWITHVAVVIAVFIICGFVFGRFNGGRGPKISAGGLFMVVVLGVVAGATLIVAFYLMGG